MVADSTLFSVHLSSSLFAHNSQHATRNTMAMKRYQHASVCLSHRGKTSTTTSSQHGPGPVLNLDLVRVAGMASTSPMHVHVRRRRAPDTRRPASTSRARRCRPWSTCAREGGRDACVSHTAGRRSATSHPAPALPTTRARAEASLRRLASAPRTAVF